MKIIICFIILFISMDLSIYCFNSIENSILQKYNQYENNIRIKFGIEIIKNKIPDKWKIKSRKFIGLIKKYSKIYSVSENLILSIIKNESGFNPRISSRIAHGLMQIVPNQAGYEMSSKIFGYKKKLGTKQLYNPEINIHLGVAYINKLKYNYFRFLNNKNKIQKICIIAAYNCGLGKVIKILKKMDYKNISEDDVIKIIYRKIPKETLIYVKSVLKDLKMLEEYNEYNMS